MVDRLESGQQEAHEILSDLEVKPKRHYHLYPRLNPQKSI